MVLRKTADNPNKTEKVIVTNVLISDNVVARRGKRIYLEARRMIHDRASREGAFEYRSQRRLLHGGWVSITRIPAIDCALAPFERDEGAQSAGGTVLCSRASIDDDSGTFPCCLNRISVHRHQGVGCQLDSERRSMMKSSFAVLISAQTECWIRKMNCYF